MLKPQRCATVEVLRIRLHNFNPKSLIPNMVRLRTTLERLIPQHGPTQERYK